MAGLPRLYEMAESYAELITRDDLDEQTLRDTLDSLNGAIEVKAQNSIALLNELEDYIEATKKREEQFKKWRKVAENRRDWLKGYWLNNMQAMGKTKIQTDLGPIAVRASKASVNIFAQANIPEKYLKTTVTQTVDKDAIYKDIKAGTEVPGAELVAGSYVKVG